MKELKIICWSTGIFVMVCMTIKLFNNPGNTSLAHPNFFIRNAMFIIGISICFFMFAIPFLMRPGFITDNPYEDALGKAKINFIGLSILMPATIVLFVSLLYNGEIVLKYLIVLFGVICVYLVFTYQLFVQIKKHMKK